jgi:magnesium-transporting ATPase (P-type)
VFRQNRDLDRRRSRRPWRQICKPRNKHVPPPRFLQTDCRFSPLIRDASNLASGQEGNAAILYTMTTCHSLKLVSDEIIGDPLDAKMFEFTGWTFEEGGRIYEFIRDEPSQEEDKEEDELLENKSESSRGHYVARDAPERSGLPAVRPPKADGKVTPFFFTKS